MVSSSKPREVGYISLKCAETNGTMAVKVRRENFIVRRLLEGWKGVER